MARTAPPTASIWDRDDDEVGIVELWSWQPHPPSSFPPGWSAPPRAEGHGPRNAVIAGSVFAVVAIAAWGLVPVLRSKLAVTPVTAARIDAFARAPVAPLPHRASTPLLASTSVPRVPVAEDGSDSHSGPLGAPTPAAPVAEVVAAHVEQQRSPLTLAPPSTEPSAADPSADQPLPPDEVATAPGDEPTVADAIVAPEPVVAPEQAVEPEPALPTVPTRELVIAAMDGVRPAVEACAAQHGRAVVWVTVRDSGRVASAVVSGTFAGTPAGSCIARAVREAQFPAFVQPTFEVSYPFVF